VKRLEPMGKPVPTKPRGRPPQPENVRRRSNLTLRIRDETKDALERRAAANGRSLSEEAETLLDRALRSTALLEQALTLAFGRQAAEVLLVLGRTMNSVGLNAALASRGSEHADTWLNDPYASDQVAKGIGRILEALRPAGEIILPRRDAHAKIDESGSNRLYQRLGIRLARDILEGIAGSGLIYLDWGESTREKLGPDLVKRIAESLQPENANG
jgi:plasmid stability protein